MAQQTRQSLMGVAMRLYGSFAGKAAAIPTLIVPTDGYVRPTYAAAAVYVRGGCVAVDVLQRPTYATEGVSQQ